MASTKLARGARELDEIDAVFAALAHASRRHILQVLFARQGAMTAGELNARFAHAWPTTRHLQVLVAAGLVAVDRLGRERHYRVQRRHLGDVVGRWLHAAGFSLAHTSAAPTK